MEFLRTPLHDVGQYLKIHAFFWKAGYGHGGDRGTAHCVHIAKGVSGCDATVEVRVIYNGREEIHCLDQRPFLVDLVYPGIVGRIIAHKNFRVFVSGDLAQDLSQAARGQLARSAGARDHLCQPNRRFHTLVVLFTSGQGAEGSRLIKPTLCPFALNAPGRV